MKKIMLIDGSGFLFRSWYAISPIIDKEWRNIRYWMKGWSIKIIG